MSFWELTPDAILRFTIGFRTLPQGTVPKVPHAKEVTVQTHGLDKYKRTIGDVILPDGLNLNQELVKQGWCWWYREYAPGDTVLEELEKDAHESRKQLEADPQPMPQWEWRRDKRSRR